jgi:hypothetical protein
VNVNVKFGQAKLTSQYSDAAPFKKDIASEAEDNPTNKRHQTGGRAAPYDGQDEDGDHRGYDEGSTIDCIGLNESPNAEQESEPDTYGLVWNAQEKIQRKIGKEKW